MWLRAAAAAQCTGGNDGWCVRAAGALQLEAQGKTRAHVLGGSGGDDMNSKSLPLLLLL